MASSADAAAAADKEEIASTNKEAQADAPAEIVAVDLPAPAGWTKKFTPKKGGTPRRNEVVFISPTGDTPRRSARISEKVKATEAPESELPKKREKTSSLAKAAKEKKDSGDGETKEEGAADGEESKVGADTEMNEADGGRKVDEQVTTKEAAVNEGTVERVEKEVNQEEAASSNAEKGEEKSQPPPALPSQTEDKERKVEEEQVEPIVHNADATEENKIGEKGLSENGSHKDNQDWPDATEGPL